MPLPLLVVFGVTVGVVSAMPVGVLCAMGVAAASIAIVAHRQVRPILLFLSGVAMCAAYGAHARDRALDSTLVAALGPLLDDRFAPPMWLEGRVADDAAVAAGTAVVPIDVARVKVADEWREVSGRATLSIGGASAAANANQWTRGRILRAPVLVRRPQMWRNFGGPSERWQRLRRPSDITGSVKSAALVEVEKGSRLAEVGASIRQRIRRDVNAAVAPTSRESAAVITAILIGDRTSLDPETMRRLQRAGTYHVIAISGGNIAIVVVFCMLLLRSVIASRRIVALITLGVVVGYGAVVGDQASVERAVAAAAVVLCLQSADLVASTWRIFLLAAAAVVVIDPLTVIDAGAWLSFGATLGILLLARPIASFFNSKIPETVAESRIGGAIITLFAATLAAELALVPVSASVFAQVSVAGLLLNFIAIPAMALVQFAGMAIVVLPFAHSIVAVAALAGHLGVRAIVGSADVVRWFPWLAWQTPDVSMIAVGMYYFAAALICLARARRVQRVAAVCATVSLAVIVLAPVLPARTGLARGWLRVTFLDVGQGDGILVQFPTGQSLLVDAGGSATGFDIGTRVVRPALWSLGVRRLDWLAVTHGDIDHAGGALSIVDQLDPREVWEGVPVPQNATMQTLRAGAEARGAAWIRLAGGQTMEVGGATIDVLNPPVPDWERPATRNDDSIVLRVSLGDVSVMLTGDIGVATERTLSLDTRPRLRVLKAPHHGSRTSSSAGLIREWLPQAVVVSVGRGNTFGHPAPDVLARYAAFGVDVFRTDRDGAIAIETDGREARLRTAAGRTWRLTAVGR